MNLRICLCICLACSVLWSCQSDPAWQYQDRIDIKGIGATGIVSVSDGYWLSDTDHGRLVRIDRSGMELDSVLDLSRPMHLYQFDGRIYIPDYFTDSISVMVTDTLLDHALPSSPDAPAGIAVDSDQMALADFYNSRIIYTLDDEDLTFGGLGDAAGEFNYPTDVHIHADTIYVADAYNNRGQVFDKLGAHIMTFGQLEFMNASTGIFANDQFIILTDFENDRVMTYSKKGVLLHIIDEGLDKPVDAIIVDNELIILNYSGRYLSRYRRE